MAALLSYVPSVPLSMLFCTDVSCLYFSVKSGHLLSSSFSHSGPFHQVENLPALALPISCDACTIDDGSN
jgi:hypothetical protein